MICNDWALRVSNPRPPRCKRGALATELSARKPKTNASVRPRRLLAYPGRDQDSLHRERAATAAGALGVGVIDAETPAIEVVVKIHGDVAQVHQAALVHHDRNTLQFEDLIELFVDGRVKVELVLKAAATAAHDAHAQVNLLGQIAVALLILNDLPHFRRRFFR